MEDINLNQLPKEEQLRRLRSWLKPKAVQIKELENQIEMQELLNKQVKENVGNNFYIHQKEKEIAECPNTSQIKLQELELERIKRDIESGFYVKKQEIILEDLNIQLESAEKSLELIKKRIKEVERNKK